MDRSQNFRLERGQTYLGLLLSTTLLCLVFAMVGCSDNSSTRSTEYSGPPSSDEEEMNTETSQPEQAPK